MKRYKKQRSQQRRERLLRKNKSSIELLDKNGKIIAYIKSISVRKNYCEETSINLLIGEFILHSNENTNEILKTEYPYNIYIVTKEKNSNTLSRRLLRDVYIYNIIKQEIYWEARSIHALIGSTTPEEKILKEQKQLEMRAWTVIDNKLTRTNITYQQIDNYINQQLDKMTF
jgi:hypothetical protein